ncbi:hypothetical protein [Marinobacter subterrani]|uniref:hypothetical protein n=1 Tax=Marinobacter subterrani TaxID=1658765 RepID=UPI002355F954|nr:hypothetical protein [Marinobacter subterrani]
MNTLNRILILGILASIGLIIGGVIGLNQSSTPELNAWVQLGLGSTALTSIAVILGSKALYTKRSGCKHRDDT